MLRSLLLTLAIFLLSTGIASTILLQIDPSGEGKLLIYVALLCSVFFGVGALFTLIFFFGSELFSHQKLGTRHFLVAIRRGVLAGSFGLILAILQLFRLVGFFEVLLLATFLVLIEYVILSAKIG